MKSIYESAKNGIIYEIFVDDLINEGSVVLSIRIDRTQELFKDFLELAKEQELTTKEKTDEIKIVFEIDAPSTERQREWTFITLNKRTKYVNLNTTAGKRVIKDIIAPWERDTIIHSIVSLCLKSSQN